MVWHCTVFFWTQNPHISRPCCTAEKKWERFQNSRKGYSMTISKLEMGRKEKGKESFQSFPKNDVVICFVSIYTFYFLELRNSTPQNLYTIIFQATQFSITYLPFSGPEEHIPGRKTVTDLIEKANISSHTFSFSKVSYTLISVTAVVEFCGRELTGSTF